MGNPLLPTGVRGGGKRTRYAQLATLLLGTKTSKQTKQNKTKDSPPGPPGAVVRSPSPDEQSPPYLGRLSQGLLHLRLPPGLVGAWTAVWERGRPPTATSRLRGCSRDGSSRFPPAHDVFDRLSLLLCCRELLGKALDSVA